MRPCLNYFIFGGSGFLLLFLKIVIFKKGPGASPSWRKQAQSFAAGERGADLSVRFPDERQ